MSSCRLYLRFSLLVLVAFVVSVIAAPAGDQQNLDQQLETNGHERLVRNVRTEGGVKAKARRQAAGGKATKKPGVKRVKPKKEVGVVRMVKGGPKKGQPGKAAKGKGAKGHKTAVGTKEPVTKPKLQTGKKVTNKPENIGLIG